MHPREAQHVHPVLARRLDAAAEVWHGLYGDRRGDAAAPPTDTEVEALQAALGARLPLSYIYFCRRAASSLPAGGPLKLASGTTPPPILGHNRRLHAGGHPAALIAFWEGDDGDYCFDTTGGSGAGEPPVVYVDHWSGDSVSPAGQHFLEWITGVLRGEINRRRVQLNGWDSRLAGA